MVFVAGSMRTSEFSRTVGDGDAALTVVSHDESGRKRRRCDDNERRGSDEDGPPAHAEQRRLAKLERLLARRDQRGARRVTVIR